LVQPPAKLPAERADRELDPESPEHALLFDPAKTGEWIESLLTIPNERGVVVDFNLYPQQRLMLAEHAGRDVTIKGRQTRASSLIIARNLRRLTTSFGLKALIITQDDAMTALFRDRISHHLQDLRNHGLDYTVHPDNMNEMVIGKEMQNHIIFASAEERVTGRSYSAQIVHASETSHWKPENAGALLGAIIPAVPGPPHGWFDMESTPNGAAGEFYDYCIDARDETDLLNRWRLHFYPWWIEPRYRTGLLGEKDCDLQLSPGELENLRLSFKPDHHEQTLREQHGLTVDQVLWRRFRERELMKTGVPFVQEYVEDFDSAFTTGQGNFFSSPDGLDHLAYYKSQVADPGFRLDGLPYREAHISFYGPNLSIWERPDPAQLYVGYMDCAEGGVGRENDYTALVILNAFTRHHAATLRLRAAPSECGAMACAVAQYYNNALLGGERGNYGSAALERCRDLRYPNIYYHMDYDRPRQQPEPWIFPTQARRDEILRVYREAIFERTFMTRDDNLVKEMGSFSWEKVRGGQIKARAAKRKHDDLVIAAAGATFLSQRFARYRMEHEQRQPEMIVTGQHGVVLSRGPVEDMPHGWLR
jgi:hypothetical protein